MHQPLPAPCRRLFAHYRDPDKLAEQHLAFVIGRLLEEGNSDDLRWLSSRVPEDVLVDWMESRGDRQLSRRSRCFWQWILETPSPPPDAPESPPIWPH